MNKNRWFNWTIAVVLIALAVFTVRQVAFSAQVVSANADQAALVSSTAEPQNPSQCPFTPEQIRSIHPVFIKEIGHTLPYYSNGPTGLDGGLLMLRYCKIP